LDTVQVASQRDLARGQRAFGELAKVNGVAGEVTLANILGSEDGKCQRDNFVGFLWLLTAVLADSSRKSNAAESYL
jgi:hypothetical protein